MKEIVILLAHLLTTVAKLLGPGGAKAVITEKLLLRWRLNYEFETYKLQAKHHCSMQISWLFSAMLLVRYV